MASSLSSIISSLALFSVLATAGCADLKEAKGETPTKIDLGTSDAEEIVELDIPKGATGFTIVVDAEDVSADDFLGVKELWMPNGDKVVADFKRTAVEGRSLTGQSGTGIGVVRVPFVGDGVSVPVSPGRWKARLGGVSGNPKKGKGESSPWRGRLHGAVFLQMASDGAFNGGVLDLDVYVPDGLAVSSGKNPKTITAATAASNRYVSDRIDLSFEMMRRLWGLDRGEVRFHRVSSSLTSIVSQEEIDAANELATATSERPAAQIVLTNRLSPDGEGEGEINGISNCLPGAVGVPGTKCSAVIVSLRDDVDPWIDASTMVHELGHFIGLEHTTEFGRGSDSLSDTPVCENSDDKAALASCPDHDNIMFPSVNSATGESELWASDMQKALVRTSPIFRAKN